MSDGRFGFLSVSLPSPFVRFMLFERTIRVLPLTLLKTLPYNILNAVGSFFASIQMLHKTQYPLSFHCLTQSKSQYFTKPRNHHLLYDLLFLWSLYVFGNQVEWVTWECIPTGHSFFKNYNMEWQWQLWNCLVLHLYNL